MRRSDVLMAGVQEVGPAIVYCLWRKGAVQHLPTLPKRVLQRNWNFPTIDAAMEGERKSFSKTSSMQAFKFAILDGFDSTKSRRCNCKVVVLKTTPQNVADCRRPLCFVGIEFEPKQFEAFLQATHSGPNGRRGFYGEEVIEEMICTDVEIPLAEPGKPFRDPRCDQPQRAGHTSGKVSPSPKLDHRLQ